MNTAETTIDKTFDQTAEHVHTNGQICPTCKLPDCKEPEPVQIVIESAERPLDKDSHISHFVCEKCGTGLTPNGFHLNGIDCQTEDEATKYAEINYPAMRAVEQRWIDLRNDLNRMTTRAMRAERTGRLLMSRIHAFEQMTAALAEGIDRVNREYEARLNAAQATDTTEAAA